MNLKILAPWVLSIAVLVAYSFSVGFVYWSDVAAVSAGRLIFAGTVSAGIAAVVWLFRRSRSFGSVFALFSILVLIIVAIHALASLLAG